MGFRVWHVHNHALQDVSRLTKTVDRVLAWDRAAPNPDRDRAKTKEIEKQIEAVYSDLRRNSDEAVANMAGVEEKAKAQAAQMEIDAKIASWAKQCRDHAVDSPGVPFTPR